jgi:D-3-phosphoglycerate dehydrogenase
LQRETKILISECSDFSLAAIRELERVAEVTLADLDRDSLLSAVRQADVLWVRLRNYIDARVLDAAPRLKVIVTPTTGLTHIDLDEAKRRGIFVLSLRGETEFLKGVRATAEHTIGLMLCLLRHIPAAVRHVNAGRWERDLFKGHDMFEKKVGIVGYGRLGRLVSQYLMALDVQVFASGPQIESNSVEPGVIVVPVTELLRDADLVTLHINLTDENHGCFGAREFAQMKQGAWFLNTSRGELVDEQALLQNLISGKLAGAALDVLSGEYSPNLALHPLIAYASTHDNLLITPHIGGCTAESMERAENFLAERLSKFICEPRVA